MDAVHQVMQGITSTYEGRIPCIYCDSTEKNDMMKEIGFTGTKEPVYCLVKLNKGTVSQTYLIPESQTVGAAGILQWLDQFMNALNPKAELRSEPVPEAIDENVLVSKMVGTTFVEVLKNRTHDLLVLCLKGSSRNRGKSKSMVERVAKEFRAQNVRTVKFFWIDLELNELPKDMGSEKWEGPTILFLPAGGDVQIYMFPVDVTISDLMQGILKNGKKRNNFKIPRRYRSASEDL
jgi:hypothetical protein